MAGKTLLTNPPTGYFSGEKKTTTQTSQAGDYLKLLRSGTWTIYAKPLYLCKVCNVTRSSEPCSQLLRTLQAKPTLTKLGGLSEGGLGP